MAGGEAWAPGPLLLPDSLLVEIFLFLGPRDLLSAGASCRQWHAVAQDQTLWRELFYRHFHIPRDVPRHPGATSWSGEFRRLFEGVPCLETQALKEHGDQVLHLSFSHSGAFFASCSKDCTAKIWSTGPEEISLQHSASMKEYNWSYTQFSQFNPDDSLLLVSGVFLGPRNSFSGEIAVFSLEDFSLVSRVRNKPPDLLGCWLNETNLLSGNLHRIGFLTSCSVLWLSNAFQDIESENTNVVKRLFKIQNLNASAVRNVMLVDCSRHDSPDLLLDCKGEASEEPRVVDLSGHSPEEGGRGRWTEVAEGGAEGGLSRFLGLCPDWAELETEAQVARILARRKTKPPKGHLTCAEGGGEANKYLVFTTGCLTYVPHQIGIKQILPHQMTTAGPVLGEEQQSDHFFDSLDHVFDIHGQIVGMGLSPDHRYLYVSCRAWPAGCLPWDPLHPPPASPKVDLRILDLQNLKEAKRSLSAYRASTPTGLWPTCTFLAVSKDFVASGAEGSHSFIWDRHYDICLAKLRHGEAVHAVAFSPTEQELLLTAGADGVIRVWCSPSRVRQLRAEWPLGLNRP
nr:F-box/WD repeat-containing protein 5 [Anolis sagrei ordinatus]XP_060613276.1 F-box/WD repeat-containing protein 5 [Anolis sagrei ordinatus]XP_060613277.1 F-box/WD repeat-containing protein 5 [Anolis sagrei ordinatus]XP_060613278.1 F-box/WD repeat-containing protein 5 [Anolis sagrei ordinatus]XP_060613279.1 F-box/WD repeat-containing protein 5 [Anolis sagrei ordinatus]XP_060613280.1 F-box/WD repeat-containing protein 5 [Anolis sagrei ordinatus]